MNKIVAPKMTTVFAVASIGTLLQYA